MRISNEYQRNPEIARATIILILILLNNILNKYVYQLLQKLN